MDRNPQYHPPASRHEDVSCTSSVIGSPIIKDGVDPMEEQPGRS